MNAFLRALRGELYVWSHRRPLRWAHLAVFAHAFLYACVMRLVLGLRLGDEGGFGSVGEWNYWPQFVGAARSALFLAELLIAVVVASSLAREIDSGAVRDPLARRLSRGTLLGAKAVVALLLPLTLYACAVGGAAAGAGLLFESGDSIEDGIVRFEEAADIIPVVQEALWHGILPLMALAATALACSALFARVTLSVGVTLGILLTPTLFRGMLGERAAWLYADVLPAFGPDSYLQVAARWSAGYNDAYPASFDRVVAVGWLSPPIAVGVFLAVALFRVRSRAV
jgi:hypothetical protein